MLKHDARTPLLAEGIPHGLPEGLSPLRPPPVPFSVGPVGRHPPVGKGRAIEGPDRPELQAEVPLFLGGHHGDGLAPELPDDLDGHGPEAAGSSPHQDDVSILDDVGGPPLQHAVGGGAHQGWGRRLLPGQVGRLGQALMGLDLGELGERAPVRLVAVDPEGSGEPRVTSRSHHRVVGVPLSAVDHHVIADSNVRHPIAHRPRHSGSVAPADVEVVGLTQPRVHPGDVQGHALGRPHVVVVDARRHHQHQGFARPG